MTFTHALATNNYGPAKFVVSTSAANGTHTTLASAMAVASAGDTIFLRDSVTENVTITPGVNIVGWIGSNLNTPSITGKLTMTGAGTSTVSHVCLITNSDFVIAVTGSAASILNVSNCYINCSNNTGISLTSSSSSSSIYLDNCNGNIGTTGITLFAHSGAGALRITDSFFDNTGATTTASTVSGTGGLFPNYSLFGFPLSLSSSSVMDGTHNVFNTTPQNVTALTTASTATVNQDFSSFLSGTASCISIGAGTTVTLCDARISSSNTNTITGAGTLKYGLLTFTGSSSGINPTTQTNQPTRYGILQSALQPAFLATHTVAQDNVTGTASYATVNFTTEIFDQNSNYDGTNTFTAPVTGRYFFTASLYMAQLTGATSVQCKFVTSNREYEQQYGLGIPASADITVLGSAFTDMDSADTCIFQGVARGMAGATADFPISAPSTKFGGYLVC